MSRSPTGRKPGGQSRYLRRAQNALMGPSQPDDRHGPWTREQLLRMDADFCAAMELAISRGLERRPQDGKARAALALAAPPFGNEVGASDHTIWRAAIDEDRTVCTINGKDFKKLAAATGLHPGVIDIPRGDTILNSLGSIMWRAARARPALARKRFIAHF